MMWAGSGATCRPLPRHCRPRNCRAAPKAGHVAHERSRLPRKRTHRFGNRQTVTAASYWRSIGHCRKASWTGPATDAGAAAFTPLPLRVRTVDPVAATQADTEPSHDRRGRRAGCKSDPPGGPAERRTYPYCDRGRPEAAILL